MVKNFTLSIIQTPKDLLTPEQQEAQALDPVNQTLFIKDLNYAIENFYLYTHRAKELTAGLAMNLENGRYAELNNSIDFARALKEDIRSIDRDAHILIRFNRDVPRVFPKGTYTEKEEEILQRLNYGFRQIERYNGGVARVEMDLLCSIDNGFVHKHTAMIMSTVIDASALILDLRNSGEGDSRTAAFILSYLFGEEKLHLIDHYRPSRNTTEEFWTYPGVYSGRFGPDKPVYVLTSHRTAMHAEEMAYILQAFKRATVVGERTVGVANMPTPYYLGGMRQFLLSIPDTYTTCPMTGGNWEDTGVLPDIPTSAMDALDVAVKLAYDALGIDGGYQEYQVQSPARAESRRLNGIGELNYE
ncbi:ClpP/crotonase-like domain-containing protein [Xylariales sp. PMI_506]|nr:ClpP/crotonase-like domain-containing protein [Xylariales sp. PMI_506]